MHISRFKSIYRLMWLFARFCRKFTYTWPLWPIWQLRHSSHTYYSMSDHGAIVARLVTVVKFYNLCDLLDSHDKYGTIVAHHITCVPTNEVGLFPPHAPLLSITLGDELGDLKGPIGCFSGGYRWHGWRMVNCDHEDNCSSDVIYAIRCVTNVPH